MPFWQFFRIISKSIHAISKILFILGLYKFLACLERISRNGLSFGHSGWHPSSVYCCLKTQAAHRYVLTKTLFGQFLIITRPIFECLLIYNLELLVLTVPLKHEAAHRYVLTKTLFGQFLAISGPILQGLWIYTLCSNAKKLS